MTTEGIIRRCLQQANETLVDLDKVREEIDELLITRPNEIAHNFLDDMEKQNEGKQAPADAICRYINFHQNFLRGGGKVDTEHALSALFAVTHQLVLRELLRKITREEFNTLGTYLLDTNLTVYLKSLN